MYQFDERCQVLQALCSRVGRALLTWQDSRFQGLPTARLHGTDIERYAVELQPFSFHLLNCLSWGPLYVLRFGNRTPGSIA